MEINNSGSTGKVSFLKSKVLWTAVVVYLGMVLLFLSLSMKHTDGKVCYPIDDTYIHMAISKHIAIDHNWGINRDVFNSSSSSPLWTLLLAGGYMIFGVGETLPLVLNIFAGLGILMLCYSLFSKICSPQRLLIYLLAVIVFLPLSFISLMGMEHTLHAMLNLLLLVIGADYLSGNRKDFYGLLILASLITVTRYEGMFTVAVISIILFFHKEHKNSVLMLVAGALPVIVFGLYSIYNGGFFFPNSVLQKSNVSDISSLKGVIDFLIRVPLALFKELRFSLLILLGLLTMFTGKYFKCITKRDELLSYMMFLLTILHLQFAQLGWFFRYEIYLYLGWITAIILNINGIIEAKEKIAFAFPGRYNLPLLTISAILFYPLIYQAIIPLSKYSGAVKNIYEQQYAMGQFISKYYNGKKVVVNDIGAVSYLSDAKIIDLVGLGTDEVCKARLMKDTASIARIASSGDIAVVYDVWQVALPGWIKCGTKKIDNRISCAYDSVSFFVRRQEDKQYMIDCLGK